MSRPSNLPPGVTDAMIEAQQEPPMRQHPPGYRDHPVWLAFELWADEHSVGTDPEDWEAWWECFLAGYEVGTAEAAS